MEKYTGPAFYQTKTKVAGENNRFKAKPKGINESPLI